jgi:hypothetical protein
MTPGFSQNLCMISMRRRLSGRLFPIAIGVEFRPQACPTGPSLRHISYLRRKIMASLSRA